MEAVVEPQFNLTYNGKNISADVSASYISCEYNDHTEGTTDEIQLVLDDTDGNWRGPWYPDKGAKLTLEIVLGPNKLKCGDFEVDEIEQSGPPHTVTIKAIAAGIAKAMRTKNSKAYDKTTLKGIAQLIAGKHGFSVVGTIENINIERSTQHRKTDLEYLRRLAMEYGYIFSIKGKQLVFTTQEAIEKKEGSLTVDLTELINYSLRDKAVAVYSSAKVTFKHRQTGKVIVASAITSEFSGLGGKVPGVPPTATKQVINADGIGFSLAGSADTKVAHGRVENQQQANAKARALLYRANTKQNEGTITMPGNTKFVAGINFMLTGLGVLSGKYHILKSVHRIDRSSGYTTELEIKRVAGVKSKGQQKPKKVTVSPSAVGTKTTTFVNSDNIGFKTVQ